MTSSMNSSEVFLRANHLVRKWGGLVAVNQVGIELKRGEIHAVIGTNGAGKSTLINLLSGEIPVSSGDIEILGKVVTNWSQPIRAKIGIGRSYQRNTIFPELTVFENCRLAAQAHKQNPWQIWQAADHCSYSVNKAVEVIEKTGLKESLDRFAGELSHGQKRQLEVAMCLATDPRILLLDEPLAGMGADETERMLNFLNELKPNHAILLVEHDMDAVFKVADRITVMVNGSVIACGTPAEVKADRNVQVAYLGDE
jgi:branched-chain amino acid transport system ATP-binding protein